MKYCKDCILKGKFDNGQWGCYLSKQPIDPNKDFCSKYKSHGYTCDNCHQIIINPADTFVVELIPGEWKTFCPNCYNLYRSEK